MNAYFMKVTKEERDNILDQHKHVYDGYVTNYIKPNSELLYVQDFANDKNGITVSNKGNVTSYKNMNINESECSECGMTEEKMCSECGMSEQMCECGIKEGDENEDYKFTPEEELMDLSDESDFDYVEELDMTESKKEKLKQEINESLNVFKRFKNYN